MCSCLVEGLSWSICPWSLLTLGYGLILVLRWRPLGELSSINIPWGWEFSGCSTSWTQVSHLRGSSPTLYCGIKTQHRRLKTPRLLVKATLNSPEHSEKHTPKSSNISRKFSKPVVGCVGSAQSQIWPYSGLYFVPKSTVSRVHSLRLIVGI